MTNDELKKLAEMMASPETKALVEKGRRFSPEKLQAMWAAVLEDEVDPEQRELFDQAFKAFMARWVH